MTRERSKHLATERLSHGLSNILPVYLSLQNPLIIGGSNETQFDLDRRYNEDHDEFGDAEGRVMDLLQAIRWVIFKSDYDEVDVDRLTGDVLDTVETGDQIGAAALWDLLKRSEGLTYATDLAKDGTLASCEILRKAIERMGFDGVIDHTVHFKFGGGNPRHMGKLMEGMDQNTVHYVAFRPHQVKSAIGNSGLYALSADPSDAIEGHAFDLRSQAAAQAIAAASRAKSVIKEMAIKEAEGKKATSRARVRLAVC